MPEHTRIAIVGTGFSGLAMAIKLKDSGIEDFVLVERGDDVGGTWRDNTYPGCQCDVPSHLYSFSFAQNPDWSRTFSMQGEIQRYLRNVANENGLYPHCLFEHELLDAAWDGDERLWRITTSQGERTADVLVSAVGGLSEPSIPALPGLDTFEGSAFHSAQWDHDHDLAGERVAVVGTGASAIQFAPHIQPKVAKLHVFQRTPAWVVPHSDRPVSKLERRLYRRFPALQRLVRAGVYWSRELLVLGFAFDRRLMRLPARLAERHLRDQVEDPELRAKLTPEYTIGCKRILLSNDWYPTLQKENVELVTDGIAEVRPRSIVTADGAEREVDTIIFGTGFRVADMPVAQRVRDGEGRTLFESWGGSARAYNGTTVRGFPNLFMLTGPNTGLGHTSLVVMIEAQVAYVMDALRAMERERLQAVAVRPEVEESYNERLQRKLEKTVWNSGGCASWYLDATGRNSTLWPDFTFRFRQQLSRFDLDDYERIPRAPVPEREPALPAAA